MTALMMMRSFIEQYIRLKSLICFGSWTVHYHLQLLPIPKDCQSTGDFIEAMKM